MLGRLNEWLSVIHPGEVDDQRVIAANMAAALVFMVLVAFCDLWSGQQISLWVLYTVPIAGVSWYKGPKHGVAAAALAVILLCIVGARAGYPYSSVFYFAIATFSQAVAFLLVVLLVASQNRLLRESSTLTRFLDSLRVENRDTKETQAPVMSGMWDIHPAIALFRAFQEMTRPGGRYEGKCVEVSSFMAAARSRNVKRIYGAFPLTTQYLEKIAKDAGFRIAVTENEIRLHSVPMQGPSSTAPR